MLYYVKRRDTHRICVKIRKAEKSQKKEYTPSEYDDAIRGLLDEYVKPAVETDGGAIEFRGFDNGVVTVLLKG